MRHFLKKHLEVVIFVGVIVFATMFIFGRSAVPPTPVILYKTTQPSSKQTVVSDTRHPVGHDHYRGRGSPLHSHAHPELVEDFETFDKLLKTDPENARRELQNISKNFFRGHLLAEEWVPLYFRITRDGFRHISDIKRVHELELRMLTAIDAEKYTKQIQQHQEAIEKGGVFSPKAFQ